MNVIWVSICYQVNCFIGGKIGRRVVLCYMATGVQSSVTKTEDQCSGVKHTMGNKGQISVN